MAKDGNYEIDNKKIAYEELIREFKGISCLKESDILSSLNKSITYRKFDALIIRENNILFKLLNEEKSITFKIKTQIFNIICIIDKYLRENKDYPRQDLMQIEKEILNRFLAENSKNIFRQQNNNVEFTYYDELVLKLSAIFKENSLAPYIYLINDTKKDLYLKLGNILKDEETEDALDLEYDLSSDTKIYNDTVSTIRSCFKKYPRVPNVYTIAPDILIEALKNYDGKNNFRTIILRYILKYLETEKDKKLTENDIILRDYIFKTEDSWYNPGLEDEAFSRFETIKDHLTKEQQILFSRNEYEYNNYGWKIQQHVLKLRKEAKTLNK